MKNMSRLLGISLIAGLGVAVGFGLSALLKGDEELSTARTVVIMAYDMDSLRNIILVRASDTGSIPSFDSRNPPSWYWQINETTNRYDYRPITRRWAYSTPPDVVSVPTELAYDRVILQARDPNSGAVVLLFGDGHIVMMPKFGSP